MQEQNRLAAVEFLEYPIKCRIARPFVSDTAQEADAIGLQRLIGVFQLFHSSFRIGVRDVCKKAEAFLVVAYHLRRKLIGSPGEGAPLVPTFFSLSTRPRNNAGLDAVLVHFFDRLGGSPRS